MRRLAVAAVFAFGIAPASAHQRHKHAGGKSPAPATAPAGASDPAALAGIRARYDARVRPIFEKKCLDCHGGPTRYPWYYRLPGAKQLIDRDVAEGKRHCDFSPGYPFVSHATREEDLAAIRESTGQGAMPPLRYRVLHPGSALDEAEKAEIRGWVDEAERLLKQRHD